MKWTYSITQKMKAAIILAVVFLLVLSNNLREKQKLSELGSSFSSVYEDRLLVESYIYKLSDHLFRKKIMMDNCSTGAQLAGIRPEVNQHNAAIGRIIADYEKTRLTTAESVVFKAFKESMQEIRHLEAGMAGAGSESAIALTKSRLNEQFNLASGQLSQLSGIQVSEGKLLNDQSKRTIAGSTLLTQFEMAILIGLGFIIQALIFASRTIVPRTQPRLPSMN